MRKVDELSKDELVELRDEAEADDRNDERWIEEIGKIRTVFHEDCPNCEGHRRGGIDWI